MAENYMHAGPEPSLAEAFHDPIVRLVMRRDRVDSDALCRVIAIGRIRLGLEQVSTSTPCVSRRISARPVHEGCCIGAS